MTAPYSSVPLSTPVPIILMARELSAGGTERQLTELARSLDPARFEVHVGCFHYGVRETELRAAGIPIVRLPDNIVRKAKRLTRRTSTNSLSAQA